MAQPYNGGLKTIVFIPVAALFGITPASVRWFTVIVALLALATYFLFARRLLRSSAVAAVTVVLLALDPSFIFFSRVDYGPSTLMFLLKGIALWQLAVWWREGRAISLVLGCFALGLGVYDKTNFLWIVGAVLGAAIIVQPRGVRARFSVRRAALAGGAFVAGALPLVIYNLSWPPRSLAPVRAGTLHLRYGNYQGNVFQQFGERVRELAHLMDGHTATIYFGYDRYLVVPLLPILAAVAAFAFLALFVRPSSRAAARPGAFVALAGLGVLLAAALTPGGDKPHHLLLVYPFPQVLAAAGAVGAVGVVRRRFPSRAATAVAIAAVGALIAVQPALGVAQSIHIERRLQATGGLGNFSDGIYRLADYLDQHDRDRKIVMLDWGMFYPVVGLSDGRSYATQLWRELNNAKPPSPSLVEQLTDPSARYVLHSAGTTNFVPPRQHFFSELRRARLRARLVRVIRTHRGGRLFLIYRLVGARSG
jgi:4-amino-4-deoxy-L-arabinose transferase-like glycosyltransferase